MSWHRETGGDLSLRAAGAALLAAAGFCGSWLRARALAGPVDGDPVAFLLAAATFLCGSGGSLLMALGAHVFDKVEVASRWRRIDRVHARDEVEGQ